MSFTITQQPSDIIPQPKSKYLDWSLTTTDFLNSPDAYATFSITFVNGAEADGLAVTIVNTFFTTDSAEPFTVDTYEHETNKTHTARNFANMLSINPDFIDWVVVHNDGQVIATRTKPGVVSPFTFSFVSFAVIPTVVSSNGTLESRKSKFVTWDLYNENTRVVGRKQSAIDPSGTDGVCNISFDSAFLFNGYEPKTNTTIWAEDNFFFDLLFRAALINQNSICQQDVEEIAQGDIFTVVNSVFQPTDELNFEPYTGSGDPLIKWVTGNPARRQLTNDFFELVGIYLVNDGTWRTTNPFSIQFLITRASGSELVTVTPSTPSGRFFFVPIGTLNGSYASSFDDIISVEIQVFAYTPSNVLTAYSQILTRTFSHTESDCKEVIVYLGDLGSFDSIRFGELRQLNQGVTAGTRIFEPGGRDYEDQIKGVSNVDVISDVQNEMVYISEPINELNRSMYEQLQRSPQIYRIKQVLGESGYVNKLEQLQMTRGNFVNMNRGGDKRFEAVLKSASGTKFHK